ncbi:hypothetical protein E5206_06225 [Arthrobacter sp. PAMC25564]|uniref:hypothetical protein n=1 Tax=Arthrobacter sp. PAMC25564 TaxID=2565366 RepID=UPI0010A28D9A|nr:hypothetical protein [Arthrobacter sp. PAMC25564]QCB96573.1 hypothetical protein E5206_06225 [Arthrobacter sp. PAMC25564]
MPDTGGLPSSQTLARKLDLLMDTMVAEGGEPYSYLDIAEAMDRAGTPLSRARWQYMRAGTGPQPRDRGLLANLARFFQVDGSYLLEENCELPDRITSQLELLRTMRAAKVRSFASRQLADLSPDTLRRISEMIEAETGPSRP